MKQYKSYKQICDFLEVCVQKYPDLIKIKFIGKTWEDRKIMLATVSFDVKNSRFKPALFYTGCVHAREWIGGELSVAFIDFLLKTKPKILDKVVLYIVPVLNPDGFEYSRLHFSAWRKNRRKNSDGSFGVDLNRNFSVNFTYVSDSVDNDKKNIRCEQNDILKCDFLSQIFPKSNDMSINIYGGPYPFSEPETMAIKKFVDNHKNIIIALDYHSQGNVFFPAYDFVNKNKIYETNIDILCANMNYEIGKITGRKYGIHTRKSSTELICGSGKSSKEYYYLCGGGSGKEYYHSLGIFAMTIEVGTKNIPDFQNMQESIDENIPALFYCLSEVQNYCCKFDGNFTVSNITKNSVILAWDYKNDENIYFQIFRNTEYKQECLQNNLICETCDKMFVDNNLKNNTKYYYYIRAVNNLTKIKSLFAPVLKIKTLLNEGKFCKIIFPCQKAIGSVAEKNLSVFGTTPLFVGINKIKGKSFGVMEFDFSVIPENAIIKNIRLSLYPLNRVNVKIEKYGKWKISFINLDISSQINNYNFINDAFVLGTLHKIIPAKKLTQGVWIVWNFCKSEIEVLEKILKRKRKILFKIHGPEKLPKNENSQMMMFDIGYGKFGSGMDYRPNIEVEYFFCGA